MWQWQHAKLLNHLRLKRRFYLRAMTSANISCHPGIGGLDNQNLQLQEETNWGKNDEMNIALTPKSGCKLVLSYYTTKKPYAWGATVICGFRTTLNSCSPWLSWDIKQSSWPYVNSDMTCLKSGRLVSCRLWPGFPKPVVAYSPH